MEWSRIAVTLSSTSYAYARYDRFNFDLWDSISNRTSTFRLSRRTVAINQIHCSWNSKPWSHFHVPYLNGVSHKTRSHLRSRSSSLPLEGFQQKYHSYTTLIPILIYLCFNTRIHVDYGCNSPLFYNKLSKQCRFHPFNESLNGPRNHCAVTKTRLIASAAHYGPPENLLANKTQWTVEAAARGSK